MRFNGKTVLVTGACHNTGLAIARAFMAEGASVYVNGIDEEDVAAAITELGGGIAAPFDISDAGAVERFFESCTRLDVLVNNAVAHGIGFRFEDTPLTVLDEVLQVNVRGSFTCSQHAARLMKEQGCGRIANISSTTASRAIRNRSAYVLSKGAINAMTRATAIELAPYGITVNAVVPGYIHSDRWADLPAGVADRRRKNLPIGNEAGPEDVAGAVLFLASEQARGITGAELVVDGGLSAQQVPADLDM